MNTLTAPALAVGDEVEARDLRQLTFEFMGTKLAHGVEHGRGTWFVLEVRGVAARLGRSPLSLVCVVTPLSNLRRTGDHR